MGLFKSRKQKNLRPTSEVCHSGGVLNAADTLLANIRFSSVDGPLKTICVTSPAPNDGKSTVSIALALAMAQIGSRVLLMEADMRRRSLRSTLGVKARYGLHAVLAGEATLEEAVVATNDQNLFFLDAEPGIPNPEQILNSRQFGQLIGQVREAYDYVVIDVPPAIAFSDASIIASKCDGTLLVVRQNCTERKEAVYAAEQLRNSGANMLGIVMNGMPADDGNYEYYYSYYTDGERRAQVRDAELNLKVEDEPMAPSAAAAAAPAEAADRAGAHAKDA